MERGWPRRGAWVMASTSADVDWRVAAAAIAAAAEVPVAAVVVGAAGAGTADPLRAHLSGLAELTAVDGVGLAQARDLVTAMKRTCDLVLVGASAGLLVPVGRDDWTLADLAAAVGAPVIVVTGPGPDAVNHTTLALGALAGRGVVATVVTIGDVDEAALPVTPSGRIPADRPDDLAGAGDWFEPMLRATAEPGAVDPSTASPAGSDRRTVSGKRLLAGLLAVFVIMVAAACGLALWGSGTDTDYRATITELPLPPVSRAVVPTVAAVPTAAVPAAPAPRRKSGDACPENAGAIAPTRPDGAMTARVDAAWLRIEKWLAKHAPASREALRAGASAASVDGLQRRMSVPFPPDLVASLRRHDGVTQGRGFMLPPFYTPDALEQILADWQVDCGVLANEAGGGIDGAWWHRDYVPFAAAGDGGSLLVDQRAGGHGRVGEFYAEDGTSFERWPASVADLLEQTATSLESGRPFAGHYRPRVADGALDWEIS